MGAITFWSLLVYVGFRLGDMAVRGQLANAFSGRAGALFAAEARVDPDDYPDVDLERATELRFERRWKIDDLREATKEEIEAAENRPTP